MRLDGGGLLGFATGRLDHIRVDGALRQPARTRQFLRLGLEHLDEFAADDLALGLGITHPGKVREKFLRGIDMNDFYAEIAAQALHDLSRFVQAQQAMIDKHAGELIANGTVHQRCRHRGIHATRKAQNDFFVAHLLADARHRFADVIGHVPVAAATAQLMHKTVQ
jgi:hypothetical protein